jgi:hypothetical protein
MHDLVGPLFLLLLASCVTGLVTTQIFFSRLRRNFEGEWIQLGRPVVFLNSGMLNTFTLIRYMWRKDFEKLGDESVTKLGKFLRSFLVFYVALFVLVVVALVFGAHSTR